MTDAEKLTEMHRLNRDGRWNEASEFRETERRRLRAEGVSKSDAVNAAWAAMLERYPPLGSEEDRQQEQLAQILALADFPPSRIDAVLQPGVTDVWRVFFRLKVALVNLSPEAFADDPAYAASVRRLQTPEGEPGTEIVEYPPSDGINGMLRQAMSDPLPFLDRAEVMFEDAITVLTAEDPDDPYLAAVRDELQALVDGMDRLRDVAAATAAQATP